MENENKVLLHDEVKPVASYQLSVQADGGVTLTYQKQLEDDAPGSANDQVINVGEAKTLTLSVEQSKAILAAVNGIVSDAINAAEAASGTPVAGAEETPFVTEPEPAVIEEH